MATNDRKSAKEVARRVDQADQEVLQRLAKRFDTYTTAEVRNMFGRSELFKFGVELAAEKQALAERVSVLERALREIMVEVERFEDSEVVVILSPEVRQLAAETERNTL